MSYLFQTKARFKGAKGDIAVAATAIIFPLLIFSIGLLLLIRYHVVKSNPLFEGKVDERFPGPELSDPNAYFVELSAGTMAFISSWSSTIALPLVGFAMLLLSYPIARSFQRESAAGDARTLPTPFQFGLLLNFINCGPFKALWEMAKYRWGWRDRKQTPMPPLVRRAICVCSATVFIGLCILAADTWLHLSIRTVEFVRIHDQQQDVFELRTYSRQITPGCINETISQYDSPRVSQRYCLLAPDSKFPAAFVLANALVAIQVVNNVSTEHIVATVSDPENNIFAFLAARSILNSPGKEDFAATSLGISTRCQMASQHCALQSNGNGNISYSCPDSVAENTSGTVGDAPTFKTAGHGTYFNPMTFWSGISLQDDFASPLRGDAEIAVDSTGWLAMVVNCSTTVHDFQYSINNGSLRFDSANEANDSVAEMVMMPWFYLKTPYISLEQQVQLAIMENTTESMLEKISADISKITVAMAAGAMVPDYTPYLQERSTILVTRVPKAPLFALIAANLLLALFGVVLAGFAYASLRSPNDVRAVQARLGFNGLLAQLFENRQSRQGPIEHLFEERVGDARKKVVVSDGGNGVLAFVACST